MGSVWRDTAIEKAAASDPYLMLGYEQKQVQQFHQSDAVVEFDIEIDFLGTGQFSQYKTLSVPPGITV